jgi:hypothetical protein
VQEAAPPTQRAAQHRRGAAEIRVDLSTISHLLGHASPETTGRYAKVDLEMKRKAIARVKPVARRSRLPWSKDSTILDWLESL